MKHKTPPSAIPFHIVVPARFSSSRLPGKPLADIAGKPMIVRVLERVQCAHAQDAIVATDDDRILAAVSAAGGVAMLTRREHESGTDRVAEVAVRMGWRDDEIVVNVQGDEPLIDPELIDAVAQALGEDEAAAIATAASPIASLDEFLAPSVVKVVCDDRGRALYFSRAPIPWPRDAFATARDALPAEFIAWRHIGLYAYRVGFLRRVQALAPAPLERWEALEQLRALCHGHVIRVIPWRRPLAPGVDTAEDLERMRAHFAEVAATH